MSYIIHVLQTRALQRTWTYNIQTNIRTTYWNDTFEKKCRRNRIGMTRRNDILLIDAFNFSNSAVSYTHLDVYKRQVLTDNLKHRPTY